jgi:hypothetical protein
MTNQSTGNCPKKTTIAARATIIAHRRFPLANHANQVVSLPFFKVIELVEAGIEEGLRMAVNQGGRGHE